MSSDKSKSTEQFHQNAPKKNIPKHPLTKLPTPPSSYWDMPSSMFNAPSTMMSEINMTPLIDVMLVLLIVFMVTLPIIDHAIPVNLPTTSSQPSQKKSDSISVTIDAQGKIYWNQTLVDKAALQKKMQVLAKQESDIQLRADRAVRYEYVAEVMALAQKNGLHKLSFITEVSP